MKFRPRPTIPPDCPASITKSGCHLSVVSPKFDSERDRRDIDLMWHVVARVDSRIEAISCDEKQWAEDDSSSLIEIARRSGRLIAA